MNDSYRQIERAIELIERRLFDDLPLATIARAAGSSPFHFHRLFSAVVGHTPAGYARKRRFAELCRQLVETDLPLIEIALAGGYQSQATFTRAFTRHIGASPARYRNGGVWGAANRYSRIELSTLLTERSPSMEPCITHRAAFHVVGMAGSFTPATGSRIPELWTRTIPHLATVPHRRAEETFGLCLDADPNTNVGAFTYIAGVEVERIDEVPADMIAVTVPAQTYAVYTHRGHISRFSDTVKLIWGSWLPASTYRHVRGPDFELYDRRFDSDSGQGEVDVYVPIEAS